MRVRQGVDPRERASALVADQTAPSADRPYRTSASIQSLGVKVGASRSTEPRTQTEGEGMRLRTIAALGCASALAATAAVAQADPNNSGGPYGGSLQGHFYDCTGPAGTPTT